MFIELTDHLRCPAEHAEQYLVLLPQQMDGRRVMRGELGCPVCGLLVAIQGGVVDFGGGTTSEGRTTLSTEAIAAFLGLSGPGGYLALIGGVAARAAELTTLLPDIGLVLINPPAGAPAQVAGVLRAPRLPLKSNSMRGIVLGSDFSAAQDWVAAAAGAVLPGLRLVGEGGTPPKAVEVLAQSPECWVGKRR